MIFDRLPDRITSRIKVTPSGCWIWTGTINQGGYGRTRWNGPRRVVHKVVYELVIETVPAGLDLDHLCRIRACCNPWHLEPVTRRENIMRGEGLAAQQAKRTHCPRNHPYSGDNLVIRNGRRFCRECARTAHLRKKQENQ